MNYFSTVHFNKRAQQRSIRDFVVNFLLNYGNSRPAGRGCQSLYFDKQALLDIKCENEDIYKKIERYKNSYIILSDDGALVTAARIH